MRGSSTSIYNNFEFLTGACHHADSCLWERLAPISWEYRQKSPARTEHCIHMHHPGWEEIHYHSDHSRRHPSNAGIQHVLPPLVCLPIVSYIELVVETPQGAEGTWLMNGLPDDRLQAQVEHVHFCGENKWPSKREGAIHPYCFLLCFRFEIKNEDIHES